MSNSINMPENGRQQQGVQILRHFYCVSTPVSQRDNRLGTDYPAEGSVRHKSRWGELSPSPCIPGPSAALLGFCVAPLSRVVTHPAAQPEAASRSHHPAAGYSGQSHCGWHIKILR